MHTLDAQPAEPEHAAPTPPSDGPLSTDASIAPLSLPPASADASDIGGAEPSAEPSVVDSPGRPLLPQALENATTNRSPRVRWRMSRVHQLPAPARKGSAAPPPDVPPVEARSTHLYPAGRASLGR